MSKSANCTPNHSRVSEHPETYHQLEHPDPPVDWNPEELGRIRRILCKLSLLRVRNPEDAEDLVQETLLTVTEKCPVHELRKGILVWAMGVLHRKVGNYYRRAQRHTSLEEITNGGETSPFAPTDCSPESHAQYSELRSLLNSILGQLPEEERRAMKLLLSGCPTHEIVRQLHPERYQNVVNRLYRARNKVHRALSKHGYRVVRDLRKRHKTGFPTS